jgi:putative transcriptional regulator
MSLRSHPSEATLLAYAAGTAPAGLSLAVAAHLGFCSDCRGRIATWETAAGAMLESMPESDLSGEALASALARLGEDAGAVQQPAPPAKPVAPGLDLPPAIAAAGLNRRRWIVPGIWTATIKTADSAKMQTYLIRLGPKQKIPLHGHSGPEVICILKGSFSDASGEYGLGDFVEIDETTDHEPVARPDGECICIIASEGPPRMRSLLGRILQPFALR